MNTSCNVIGVDGDSTYWLAFKSDKNRPSKFLAYQHSNISQQGYFWAFSLVYG